MKVDRKSFQIAVVALAACAHTTPAPAILTCLPTPPTTARPPDWAHIETLAGRYELTLVNTGGGYGDSVGRGVLELWPNDSARRAGTFLGRSMGNRPLAGIFIDGDTSKARAYDERMLRDPNRPGVELIGSILYMGGIDVMDGSGERLSIRAVNPDGFWGGWHWDGGIALLMDTKTKRIVPWPSGHFCALRIH